MSNTETLCRCGCGQEAPVIKRTNTARGHIKGERHACVIGHNKRLLASLEMLMKNVSKGAESDCWLWTGRLNRKGYGDVQIRGVKHNAHRAVFIEYGNTIPDDYHLDHLCRNKRCVNPAHMEPVTLQENVRRQHAARRVCERIALAAAEAE